jgi:hypothetical protein
LKVLKEAAISALHGCREIPSLGEDEYVFEMDFIVRLYHALVVNGLQSRDLLFQWKYDSIGTKHIDLIIQGGGSEIAVEVEPINHFWQNQPYLRRESFKRELKSVGNKLRSIEEREVKGRVILVPYIGRSKELQFPKIEAELQDLVGEGVKVLPVG